MIRPKKELICNDQTKKRKLLTLHHTSWREIRGQLRQLHIFITFGSIKDNGWFTATLHMLPVSSNRIAQNHNKLVGKKNVSRRNIGKTSKNSLDSVKRSSKASKISNVFQISDSNLDIRSQSKNGLILMYKMICDLFLILGEFCRKTNANRCWH